MDRLPENQRKKIVETTVRFFILKTRLKLRIDCLKCKAYKLLKQRLDFPFEKEIETVDRFPKIKTQKIVERTVRFSI